MRMKKNYWSVDWSPSGEGLYAIKTCAL